jgi:predicted RNA binding protein YcfA (HicA-like mRNA interferase family)/predicted RNase H-like HicB family nuclease
VKYREIIRMIEADGWRLSAHRGSHRQYEHPTKPGKVAIAGQRNRDVPRGHGRQYHASGRTWEAEAMSEYLVVIEHEGDSWGADCPDLPGLGVVGETREEVEQLIREAIPFHLEGLRNAGDPISSPSAVATTLVDVPAA